jgi:hypothetical protein
MAPWTKEAIGQITGVPYSVQRGLILFGYIPSVKPEIYQFTIQSSLDGFDGVPAVVNSGVSL